LLLAATTLVLAAQTPDPAAAKPEAVAAAPAQPAADTAAPAQPAADAAAPAQPAADNAAATPSPDTEAQPAPASKGKAVKAKPVDQVLARIGNETIRDSDFNLFMETTLNDQQRLQVQLMPDARAQYLARFLEYKVLAAKARKLGLQKRPEHAKKLAIMDMQLLIQSLMERDGEALQAKLNVTDDDVKTFFDKHPDKFVTPESFSARHILVSTRADGDKKAPTDEEALAKINKIAAEIRGGKSFADAAKEYSDDPGSKDNGGLYEDAPFGKFVPEFDQAVRNQTIGKMGEPVKTVFGYHLIQVEKITPAAAQTFDQAKDSAREMATAERQEQVMQAYLAAARKDVGYLEGAGPAAKGKPAAKLAKPAAAAAAQE
jgi:parvulin-like peptidyl-prolyl isomerase